MNYEELIRRAKEAKESSYSPYSHFRVGAALLCKDGSIYTGCNIENAAYTPTNCAERTAIFKAVSEGQREFCAIAVAGDTDEGPAPCGVCRQVMAEFADPAEFDVVIKISRTEWRTVKLEELFPYSFSSADLKK